MNELELFRSLESIFFLHLNQIHTCTRAFLPPIPSYVHSMGLTCEVAGENRFYRESRCNNAIENVGPNAGKENPYVFNWRNNKFCQKMCFEVSAFRLKILLITVLFVIMSRRRTWESE